MSTASKMGRTKQVILDLLAEHEATPYGLPTTIRFVFYELEQRGLACKPRPDDSRRNRRRSIGWPPGQQDVTDALTQLREAGSIPWDWIADEERSLTAWAYADTVAEYVHERVDFARINPWEQPPPMILTESKATALALRRLAGQYLCPIGAVKGQSSGFLHTVIAAHLSGEAVGRRIIYLGDLDKSGHDIEAHTRRVLVNEGWRGSLVPGRWQRLAMTEDLARAHGITPMWKVDGRSGQGHWATEVESLGQGALVDLLRSRLDEMLPEPLAHVHEREERQRERVRTALADLAEEEE